MNHKTLQKSTVYILYSIYVFIIRILYEYSKRFVQPVVQPAVQAGYECKRALNLQYWRQIPNLLLKKAHLLQHKLPSFHLSTKSAD